MARLAPPEWPAFPAGWRFAELYRKAPISAIEAARVNAQAIAVTLAEVGVNVDCLPVLDVRREGASDITGDRTLGDEPMQVAALGRAMLEGLEAGGVCGVVKHMPGHGRARADSHVELPIADADEAAMAEDLAPFRALRDAPMGMVAHILYPLWDAERAASVSPVVIAQVIRAEGLKHVLSDDIGRRHYAAAHERARAGVDSGAICAPCAVRLEESKAVAGAIADRRITHIADRAWRGSPARAPRSYEARPRTRQRSLMPDRLAARSRGGSPASARGPHCRSGSRGRGPVRPGPLPRRGPPRATARAGFPAAARATAAG